jgi:hypothetical protein
MGACSWSLILAEYIVKEVPVIDFTQIENCNGLSLYIFGSIGILDSPQPILISP